MAIYTNYGRYLKAKLFKESLETTGDTYMLFGLGNPEWDNPEQPQQMPVAPYNTSIIKEQGQFYDPYINVHFNNPISQNKTNVLTAIENSNTINTTVGLYYKEISNIYAPTPCIWNNQDRQIVSIHVNPIGEYSSENVLITIKQSNYQNFYITKDITSNTFILHQIQGNGNDIEYTIQSLPQQNSLERQYFSEMYLRGTAIKNGIRTPVGLLGAIKCNIDFVKDIGTDDTNYTGDINQFWYGDRYWQIVRPHDPIRSQEDITIDEYIGVNNQVNQDIYPHHLIFTTTVNPRMLCPDLQIDQYIVPRQIGIYTVAKKDDIDRKKYYRAYENVFDFGQYSINDNYPAGKDVLKFTLPVNVPVRQYSTHQGDFEFLLNDYIRGQIRETHTIDRIGYVVGF